MNTYEKLYNGITQAAFGYLFIFININLGTVNIIPDFVGYILFLSAISRLKEFIAELALLRTLGIIMTAWHFADWIFTIIGWQGNNIVQIIGIIITIINLYFHFQLLTDFSTMAKMYQRKDCTYNVKILSYRTFIVIILTFSAIFSFFVPLLGEMTTMIISAILALCGVTASILLLAALFGLRKNLSTEEEYPPEEIP